MSTQSAAPTGTAAAPATQATAPATTVEVTEADLLKSIQALEGKTVEPAPTEPPKTVVKTTELLKSLAQRIEEEGTEVLKKSIDASAPLKDMAAIVGVHVDAALSTLQKSIQAGAERDHAIVSALGALQKSIDANTEAIKKYGEAPAGTPASTRTPAGDGTSTGVLNKGLEGSGKLPEAAVTKRNIAVGLEHLVKSLPPGSQEANAALAAAVKFESTGDISDYFLQRANGAYKSLSQGK